MRTCSDGSFRPGHARRGGITLRLSSSSRSWGFELVEDSPALTNDGYPKRWVVVRPPEGQTGILLAQADGVDQASIIGNKWLAVSASSCASMISTRLKAEWRRWASNSSPLPAQSHTERSQCFWTSRTSRIKATSPGVKPVIESAMDAPTTKQSTAIPTATLCPDLRKDRGFSAPCDLFRLIGRCDAHRGFSTRSDLPICPTVSAMIGDTPAASTRQCVPVSAGLGRRERGQTDPHVRVARGG